MKLRLARRPEYSLTLQALISHADLCNVIAVGDGPVVVVKAIPDYLVGAGTLYAIEYRGYCHCAGGVDHYRHFDRLIYQVAYPWRHIFFDSSV